MRWLITNRNLEGSDGFGKKLAELPYWQADANPQLDLTKRGCWTKSAPKRFQAALAKVASKFPDPAKTPTAQQ